MERAAGILMHISSLDNEFGIGTLGKEAYEFVDFLKESGQRYWQVLPIGPTSYGDSPYQSFSSFAGNPYFISLTTFPMDILIDKMEYSKIDWGKKGRVNYEILYKKVYPLLRKSYKKGIKLFKKQIEEFYDNNKIWLEDYALFMAIKERENGLSWQRWSENYKFKEKINYESIDEALKSEIEFWIFIQYIFNIQWNSLKFYANKNNIKIIGDIPIYCSEDSSDVWGNRNFFSIDIQGKTKGRAGCPPDYFAENGQLWGNPTYNWENLRKSNYNWWIDRLKISLNKFDIIRIDHFRGFQDYWEVSSEVKDASEGKWIKGPGEEFLSTIEKSIGRGRIIAEDLGIITDEVTKLRKKFNIPGMNVLQFAFKPNGNSKYLIHNHERDSVVYTGTHDNETLYQWISNEAHKDEVEECKRYLSINNKDDIGLRIIKAAYLSNANLVIIPIQDFIKINKEGRMNIPGTNSGNWSWRIDSGKLNTELSKRIEELVKLYRR